MIRGYLASFEIPDFRNLWISDVLSLWGFEMETLILGWYVLIQTDSALMVGIVAALRSAGTLISPVLGVYVDRLSKRNVFVAMRIMFTLVAVGVALSAWSDALEVWHVMLAAGVSGLLRPPEMVVRQSLIGDSVPKSLLMNAVGLNRITMDTSKVVGALAGAGVMATFGIANAYVLITVMYLGSIVFSLRIKVGLAAVGHATSNAYAELTAGFAHIRSSRILSGVMILAFFANLAAFPLTHGLLPMLARDVFGLDELGLAQLAASAAAGALTGSILIGIVRVRADVMMLAGLLAWQVLIIGVAFAPTMVAAEVLLFLTGLASSFGMISMLVVLLQRADPQFRGRVMGVRMLAVYGLPVGLLIGGAMIEWIGVRETIGAFGVAGLLAFGVETLRWRASAATESSV